MWFLVAAAAALAYVIMNSEASMPRWKDYELFTDKNGVDWRIQKVQPSSTNVETGVTTYPPAYYVVSDDGMAYGGTPGVDAYAASNANTLEEARAFATQFAATHTPKAK